jgi:DNA-binding CsgD family transcriptional regulator
VVGLSNDDLQDYLKLTENSAKDPRTGYWMSHRNRLVTGEEIISDRDLDRTELAPYLDRVGSRRVIASMLDLPDGHIACFGFARPRTNGPYNERETQNLALLLPHVRRMFTLQLRLGALETTVASLHAAIDRLAGPVFLVGASGFVVHANSAGQEELRRGRWLTQKDGRLTARQPRDRTVFSQLLSQAISGGLSNPPTSLPMVLRDAQGATAVVQIDALPGLPSVPGVPASPVAVFLVGTGPRPAKFPPGFGFTASETRLAELLVAGFTPVEAADQLEVSRNTVKTHLNALFVKTGTHRQSQLIAFLHALGTIPLRR